MHMHICRTNWHFYFSFIPSNNSYLGLLRHAAPSVVLLLRVASLVHTDHLDHADHLANLVHVDHLDPQGHLAEMIHSSEQFIVVLWCKIL